MSSTDKETRQRVCKHLRSKEMYHSKEPMKEDDFHSGLYWCDQTSKGLGPDGTYCDSWECAEGRACFEE